MDRGSNRERQQPKYWNYHHKQYRRRRRGEGEELRNEEATVRFVANQACKLWLIGNPRGKSHRASSQLLFYLGDCLVYNPCKMCARRDSNFGKLSRKFLKTYLPKQEIKFSHLGSGGGGQKSKRLEEWCLMVHLQL